ncbi:MAG: hypothetical protein CR986_01825 [Ignavibacteriae bacterium]|nr:MAG: hypothetical protein CR986_01825 [Ignavibacteriota bacterium]
MRLKSALLIFFLTFGSILGQPQFEKVTLKIDKISENLQVGETFELTVNATVDEGWHINSNTPREKFLIPSVIKAEGNGIELLEVKYPKPLDLKLSISEKPISCYEGTIKFVLILKAVKKGTTPINVKLNYQSCNDRSCLPPTLAEANTELTIKQDQIKSEADVTLKKEDDKEENTFGEKTAKEEVKTQEKVKVDAENKDVSAKENIKKVVTKKKESKGLFIIILGAFLGGMILNLMPCVLPVLSIKILGLVQQANEAKETVFKHGLVFTLGVLVSFWILAGLLLILRAGGESIGWGFQLQSPVFIVILVFLMFLFGLSLFGVFEIGTSLTGAGQNVTSKSGYSGSFFSGIMATVVATPCTAPFMGSALGFAISQPALISIIVFTAIGLGMAFPYLLITAFPKLLKFIPKPGAWMETMKQFMGFLLVATAIWLIWVLSSQVVSDSIIILLFALMFASIGAWVWGRWGTLMNTKKTRTIAFIVAAILVLGAGYKTIENVSDESNKLTASNSYSDIWGKFSPELVAELRNENKAVFVDFTAKWCLSCQTNKKVALHDSEVEKKFKEKGVITLIADWTNRDEIITKALEEFDRNSVPLYILYPKNGKEPIVLPEILTPSIVIEALEKL